MTMKDAINLCNGLQTTFIEQLVIQSSEIDDDKVRLLCGALLKNSSLSYVDLSHNKIGNSGARGLGKLLAQPHSSLKVLKLCNNQISVDGAKCLGKALQQNKVLQSLDLRLNRLHDEGGYCLMVLLLTNRTLISLDISGNGLESRSVVALCALLKQNSPGLLRIDISCNKLGNQTDKSISVQNLKEMSEIKPNDATGKQIFEAVTQNKVQESHLVHHSNRFTYYWNITRIYRGHSRHYSRE
jgi:Ran GTPase-activating protein (RanGAP) involved in mRNA processing and transport